MTKEELMIMKILDSRENRVKKQRRINEQYGCTIISFSMNIPGLVKDKPIYRKAFGEGVTLIDANLESQLIRVLDRNIEHLDTGSEGIFAVDGDAMKVKKIMLDIEKSHSLGRFFDIDVLDKEMKGISRSDVGYARRLCFICNKEATECRREGNHTYPELVEFMDNAMFDYFKR